MISAFSFPLLNSFNRAAFLSKLKILELTFPQESMKNLRDSLPSWIDSDRAAAVGSLKVNLNHSINFIKTQTSKSLRKLLFLSLTISKVIRP